MERDRQREARRMVALSAAGGLSKTIMPMAPKGWTASTRPMRLAHRPTPKRPRPKRPQKAPSERPKARRRRGEGQSQGERRRERWPTTAFC